MNKNRLAELLDRGVAVVMLRMQGLPGNRKVPDTEIVINGKQVDIEDFSAPTMRLLPSEWSHEFSVIHGKAERAVKAASPPRENSDVVPLPVGCHLIAASRKAMLQDLIESLERQELTPLKERFIKAFPDILESLRKKINDNAIWSRIESKLPTGDQLRRDIRLRLVVLPFTFLNEVGRGMAEEMAEGIIAGISAAINSELLGLQAKINAKQKLKSGSLTQLRQQFQLLQDFSFLATSDTLSALNDVELALSGDNLIEQLNFDIKANAGGAVETFTEMLTALNKEVKADAGGRFRRKLQFGEPVVA